MSVELFIQKAQQAMASSLVTPECPDVTSALVPPNFSVHSPLQETLCEPRQIGLSVKTDEIADMIFHQYGWSKR